VEGPQVRHYRDWVNRLTGHPLIAVAGERAAQAEPFVGLPMPRAASRGKLLFLPFTAAEALRIHCLMFGDLRVNEPRPGTRLTLRLQLPRDVVEVYLGAVKRVPAKEIDLVPPHLDLMDERWDPGLAWRKARKDMPDAFLTDALLDQSAFAGLGNKIKTEALFRARLHPSRRVRDLSTAEQRRLMREVAAFAALFFETFGRSENIQPHMQIYRRRTCPACGGPVARADLGELSRRNHYCPRCQPVRLPPKPRHRATTRVPAPRRRKAPG
jgi:endonuclease-8